jgi:hypothetical protein
MDFSTLLEILGLNRVFSKNEDSIKRIKVRFPSMAGDTNRTMTIQELKEDYKDYLIIDPKIGEQVDLEKLANLDVEEVVVMPPISGG